MGILDRFIKPTVKKDDLLTAIRTELEKAKSTSRAHETPANEVIAKLREFARGYLGTYTSKNADWRNDQQISDLFTAASEEDLGTCFTLINNFYFLLDKNAAGAAKNKSKPFNQEERDFCEKNGILPPIALHLENKFFEIVDGPGTYDEKYEALKGLAFSPENTTVYKGACKNRFSTAERHVWVDNSATPPVSGLVGLEIRGAEVQAVACSLANAFLVIKTDKGYDLMARGEKPGEFLTQDQAFSGRSNRMREKVTSLAVAEAANIIVPVRSESSHVKAKGRCPSCDDLTTCGNAQDVDSGRGLS